MSSSRWMTAEQDLNCCFGPFLGSGGLSIVVGREGGDDGHFNNAVQTRRGNSTVKEEERSNSNNALSNTLSLSTFLPKKTHQ